MPFSWSRSSSTGGAFSWSRTEEEDEFQRVSQEVSNYNSRLGAVGEQPKTESKGTLNWILDKLSRTGYAGNNLLREFVAPGEGATPNKFDPLQAYKRGFFAEEKTIGKDITSAMGLSEDPYFKTKLGPLEIAPNTAGIAGLAVDLLNPLDAINWVGVGQLTKGAKLGKAAVESAKGINLVEKTFGREVMEELGEKLGTQWLNTVSQPTVGRLVKTIGDRAQKLNIEAGVNPQSISDMLQKAVETGGYKPSTRIQPREVRKIGVNISAPFTNKKLGQVYIPGSRSLLNVTGALKEKVGNTAAGQVLGHSFNPNFTPNTVPAGVWTKFVRQGAPPVNLDTDKFLGHGVDNLPVTPTTILETKPGDEAYQEVLQGLKRMGEKARIGEQRFEKSVADIFDGTSDVERKEILKAALYPDHPIDAKLKPMVESFKVWRQDVVDTYKNLGINFTPLENYVPFITSGKPLTKDEISMLKGIFGPGVRNVQNNDLLDMIAKSDPSLRHRSFDAIDPSKINEVLGREWLTEDAAVAMARRGVRAVRGQEAATFLQGVAEKYGLKVDDVNALQHLPDGYAVVIPKVQSTGRVVLEASDKMTSEGFALPQEFARAYNEYTDLMFNPESQNKILRFIDQLTRAYKTMAYMWNPGHIPRDFLSNVYNLWLMDVRSPIPYMKASQVMTTIGKMTPDAPMKVGSWSGTSEEFYHMLEDLGVTDSGSVLAEFIQAGSDWSFRIGGKYTDIMRKMTRTNDNFARVAGVIDRMEKGDTPEQAAALVKKYLFDYFDLTPFEKSTMKRVIPFYTWMRKNIPLQVESLVTKPGKLATANKVMTNIGTPAQEGEAPDFITDAGGIKVGGEDGVYILPNLSYADLAKLPTDMTQVRELAATVNPLLRAPVEMLTNTSLFSGQPIERYSGERKTMPFGQLLEGEGLNLMEKAPTLPARTLGYLLDQIPPLRTASTIANPTHPRREARMLSVLGGPQIYPVGWATEAATYEKRDELRDLVRSLQDRGIEIPTTRELKKKRKGGAFSWSK